MRMRRACSGRKARGSRAGQIQEGLTWPSARAPHTAPARIRLRRGRSCGRAAARTSLTSARRWLACSVIAAGRAPSLPRAAVVRHVRRGVLARWCAARCCSRTVCKLSRVSCTDSAARLSCAARLQDAMSSEDASRAKELFWKGCELRNKGHILRAFEYFGRAAEAARTLDPGPDNLVVLNAQVQQLSCLLSYFGAASHTNIEVDERILAARRTECISLFSAVISALEQRRIAGTLLASSCAAAEEGRHVMQLLDVTEALAALCTELSGLDRLAGYETFLDAATNVILVLAVPGYYERECSAAQFQSFAQHVVNATDLMQQPRCVSAIALSSEIFFAKAFLFFLSFIEQHGSKLDNRLLLLLKGAWQRLEQSGVLETRSILDEARRGSSYTDGAKVSINAALTAPGLRSCVLERCGTREAHPQHFKQCAACRTVVYCCKEHQLEDWPTHKAACKAARKASAAAADRCAGPGDSS